MHHLLYIAFVVSGIASLIYKSIWRGDLPGVTGGLDASGSEVGEHGALLRVDALGVHRRTRYLGPRPDRTRFDGRSPDDLRRRLIDAWLHRYAGDPMA